MVSSKTTATVFVLWVKEREKIYSSAGKLGQLKLVVCGGGGENDWGLTLWVGQSGVAIAAGVL